MTRKRLLLCLNDSIGFATHRWAIAKAARDKGYDVHVAAADRNSQALIEEGGFTFHKLFIYNRHINPLCEVMSMFSMIVLLLKVRPSVLHCFTIKPVLYGGLMARIVRVPAVVCSITGLGYVFTENAWKSRLLKYFVVWGYRMVFSGKNVKVIFQNGSDRNTLVGYRVCGSDQTVLIPGSGVNVEKFSPLAENPGPITVALPARLLWHKGIREFVEAARIVRQSKNIIFALVGEPYPGNPTSVPKDEVLKWQEAGIIEYWGWQKDMLSVYQKAHIICLPSYREGLSKVLLEAAACARPIVTTDAPGCRDMVRDGENGYLVPVKSIGPLAEKIMHLAENRDLRLKMGKVGRELVCERFDVDTINNLFLNVYHKLSKTQGEPGGITEVSQTE